MERDIAVIGLSCVFPGAVNADQFWSNNVNGVDAIGPIPKERWPNVDFSRLPPDHDARIACTRGGFLPVGAAIDPQRHGLMPNLIRSGDPDQFVMIGVVHDALDDAGVADDDPIRQRTDCIVGRGGYMSVKMAETFLRVDLVSRIIPFLREQLGQLDPRQAAELEAMLAQTLPKNDPESYVTCIPNLVASRVSNRLNLRGSAYVVDAACASSLIAVEQAVDRLRNRHCDLAIAGGIHLCQNPSFWFVFTHLRALSASGVIRPFDRRADGLLLGEGAGAVVLKRLADAYRDGDRIYAVIKGVGSASDGRDVGVLSPSARGQVAALERAYADARLEPRSISLLEAHGTGTMVGDAVEVQTIKRFYGTCSAPTRVMGSVKSMIGHAMPAAGMASLVRTILAVKNKVLPPTINCEEPRDDLKDAWFYVLGEARPWIHPAEGPPRRAGVNSFGFGGVNAHVILEEVPEVNPVSAGRGCTRPFHDVRDRAAEPVLFSAPTREELLGSLNEMAHFLASHKYAAGREQSAVGSDPAPGPPSPAPNRCSPDFTLGDVAFSRLAGVDFDHPVKLALICRDLDELGELVADCVEKLRQGQDPVGDEEHLHFSDHAATPRGKVAFMFPGMAFPGLIGNFPDHMLQLCIHFPPLRDALDRFEGKDGDPDDTIPFSCVLSPPRSFAAPQRESLKERVAPPKSIRDEQAVKKIRPEERNMAGTGTTLSNWMGWKLLEGLGVRPDMVCGQSAGDLTALAVAGVLDFERDVIPKLWEGLSVPADYLTRGCLAFVSAGIERVEPYLADKPNVHVAIEISPEAVLFGGAFDQIDRLCSELRRDEIMAIGLPYLPGHTPRMQYLKDELVYNVDDSKILGPPRTPAYSALSADLFPPERERIRDLLMNNLVSPVRFWQTTRRLHEDGARVFIQAGCGTLAANVVSTLNDESVVSVAVDVEERDPIVQLSVMIGMLFTAGVRMDASFVFKHRRPRRLSFDSTGAADRCSEPARRKRQSEIPLALSWPFYSPKTDPTESWLAGADPGQGAGGGRSEVGTTPLASHNLRLPASDSRPLTTHHSGRVASGERRVKSEDLQGTGSHPSPLPPHPLPVTGEGAPRTTQVSRMPFVGRIVHFVPHEEIVVERTLDLEEDLYLTDHYFINAASVKSIQDCMPVFPMVMMMEAMAEAAVHLAPGTGLIGMEDIRALRWVDLEGNRRPVIRVGARLSALDEASGVHYVQVEISVREKDQRAGARRPEAAERGEKRAASGVEAEGPLCATATVLLAAEYREDLPMVFPEPQNPGPWPITAEQLYRDGHTFHGPRFQTVSSMDVLGDNCVLGKLRVLPRDNLFASQPQPELLIEPPVIDGAGQLFGSWTQTRGGYILPVGIDKLEIYRPSPPPGTEVPVRLEVIRFDLEANTAVTDIEVQDGEGYVWMRIRGWRDRVFIKESRFMEVHRAPERRCFSNRKALPSCPARAGRPHRPRGTVGKPATAEGEPAAAESETHSTEVGPSSWRLGGLAGDFLPRDTVSTEMTEDHLTAGAFTWIAALHLTAEELARVKPMRGKRRSQFLLGRIAVKDAVRQWLAEREGAAEMIHPAAISIGQLASGQPFVQPIPGVKRLPEISLSHTDGRTVAVASSVPVGIDVEPLSRQTERILDDFATPEEARTIRSLSADQPTEAWPTRLWCAKESASKAIGTGLGGGVRDFELVAAARDGQLRIRHRPSSRQLVVATLRDGEMILAYATLAKKEERDAQLQGLGARD